MLLKKQTIFFLLLLIILPTCYAYNYGSGVYGSSLYSADPAVTPGAPGGGGGGGGGGGVSAAPKIEKVECVEDSDCGDYKYCYKNKCYDAECFSNMDCKKDESCWNYRCIKWFDVEILEFESPVKVGEFFDFTYFLKAIAEINGDVEVKFWIEQDGKEITSGQDTIYFAGYEEKTKNKNLFLPADIDSGTYTFYIEVTYGTYSAKAYRTIGIVVDGDSAVIMSAPEAKTLVPFIIGGLVVLGLIILIGLFYFERKKITENKWIKKYRLLIGGSLLFIILGILGYYFDLYSKIGEKLSNFILLIRISNNLKYGIMIMGCLVVVIALVYFIIHYSKRKVRGGSHRAYKNRIGKRLREIRKI